MAQILRVHGSHNTFFLLDQTKLETPLNDDELKKLATNLTDHHHGLLGGADGLLVINQPTHTGADAQMRVINADGSEASMCGNGLRTVARYVSEKLGQDQLTIETMDADLAVRKQPAFAEGVPAFAVEISPVRFNASALPFQKLGHDRLLDTLVPELLPAYHFSAIAVPNPHLIAFVNQEQMASDDLGRLGKWLNGDNPYFTDGVNVNFAQILKPGELFVRTYERGVGFTNACGTGMSATSLALLLTHPEAGQFDQPLTVYNPGGMVRTIVHHDNHRYWIELIGNATFTHQITIHETQLHAGDFDPAAAEITATGEEEAYQQFVKSLPKVSPLQKY